MQIGLRHTMRGEPVTKISQGISWDAYWASRLDFWYKARSGNEFTEFYTDNAFPAKILPRVAQITATQYLKLDIADFASTITSGYVTIRFWYDGSSTTQIFFASADTALTTKYFQLGIIGGKLRASVINAAPAISNHCASDDGLAEGWHIVKFESIGGHYQITVDGSVLTVGLGLSMLTGSDDGKWIGDVLDRDNITVGAIKRTGIGYSNGDFYIDYIDFNNTNKWHFAETKTIEIDIIGDLLLTYQNTIGVFCDEGGGFHYLNVGFSVWKKDGSSDWILPYTSAGVPYDDGAGYLAGQGYAKDADYDGITDGIIYGYAAPALIGFNESGDADSRLEIFDRSNTTRQEDISRSSGYYDSTSLATKSRYALIECLYIEDLKTLFKTGYKNRIFPVNDNLDNPTKVTGFMVAKTDLT